MKKILSAHRHSLFFLIQLAVAGFNYLFLILASIFLGQISFGSFSLWMAQLAMAGIVGGLIQTYYSYNLQSINLSRSRVMLLVAALTICAIGTIRFESIFFLDFAIYLFSTIVFNIVFGLGLKSGQYVKISLANLLGISSKFIVLFFSQSQNAFRISFLMSSIGSAIFILLLFLGNQTDSTNSTTTKKSEFTLILSSIGLSIFNIWTPQLDLLMASQLTDAAHLGEVAKNNLVTKIIFYLFQIFSQLLIAYRPEENKNHPVTMILNILKTKKAIAFAILAVLTLGGVYSHLIGTNLNQILVSLAQVISACAIFYFCQKDLLTNRNSLLSTAFIVLGFMAFLFSYFCSSYFTAMACQVLANITGLFFIAWLKNRRQLSVQS